METKKFQIDAPNIQSMKVKIVGLRPLIFHRWSEKAKRMMLDKQQKKANKGHAIRDPKAEYMESFYFNSEKKIAFPALSIKQCLTGAARSVEGLPMTIIRQAINVIGDDKDGFTSVKHKEKVISLEEAKSEKNGASMREDMVRVGMGTADLRYRGQVEGWTMDLLIQYNADVVSAEQVLNLLQIAGFACGLGEWRPERNGDFGTFEVEKTVSKAKK